jgi:transcriptional regulator with XRE-family HTH domain
MSSIMGTPVKKVNRFSGSFPSDNIGMSIGTRVKEARKAAKLTQEELSKRSGLKQSTISDLEVGKSQGTTYLASLAAALGVNAMWLETGRGPREAGQATRGQEEPGILDLKAETVAELRLLGVYRLANDREREAIDNLIKRVERAVNERARDQTKRA